MKSRDVLSGRQWLGRLEKGEDILEAVTEFARRNQIRLGIIQGIGALQKAKFSIYDQVKKQYHEIVLDEEAEVTSLSGNISMKDGAVFCHLHITLANGEKKAMGGHVCPGCIVFALEFEIREMIGEDFHRMPDEGTGLSLWEI
ncbi:DNA-binding protein [Candidatus Sumerlaeota bacterium]|nr:DNA-binding protein [Candidatus Sumerlaeota bacterium]